LDWIKYIDDENRVPRRATDSMCTAIATAVGIEIKFAAAASSEVEKERGF
jgi:hypothetical protein